MDSKYAFFDIDGTLTSEIDGTVSPRTVQSIQTARNNGHRLFICTGRCLFNIDPDLLNIGFDGAICGCGTHILLNGYEQYHYELPAAVTHKLLNKARELDLDILFESATSSSFDKTRTLKHENAIRHLVRYRKKQLEVFHNIDDPAFTCDKLIIFATDPRQAEKFLAISEKYLYSIDRGGGMYELVPIGCSKGKAISTVLEHYGALQEQTYAFGDSKNDLTMFESVSHSIVMGNAEPPEIMEKAWFVTRKASDDGISFALSELRFLS